MNNYKSYGKLVKVKESTLLKLKEIKDSEKKKSIERDLPEDWIIMLLGTGKGIT